MFQPDYTNVVKAAYNIKSERMPLYDHKVSVKVMEEILGKKFGDLYNGNTSEKREFFRNYNNFFKEMGYDTVSFECTIRAVMPGSGALDKHIPGAIRNRSDFEKYPWDSVPQLYFEKYSGYFQLLSEEMPEGMKAVGGPGNGVFECVQDVVGYMDLCYIMADDPDLYDDLFNAVGSMMYKIWEQFMERFSDAYAVLRFGDDLGFKTSTLLPPEHIKTKIIPWYKKIIELVHSYNKPFLLHSCGKIIDVMDDLINVAKIDAKHSNEDIIAPISFWIDNYGDRIGIFGGIDTDVLCEKNEDEIKEYTKQVISCAARAKGFALGSGNSIPDYVPAKGYLAMVETARKARGE
ncbi:MAG TPA: hypothetical protein GXX14_11350 [Clostridiaceae bacterium]|nr:hypothetical protein [Clostridiaceae bacterium]